MPDEIFQAEPAVREASSSLPEEPLNPFLLHLLAKRGLTQPDQIAVFLKGGLEHLLDPFLMKGMAEAVLRIQQARDRSEQVLIHGDYDVDGVAGSAIVAKIFEKMRIPFQTFLPDRVRDGYGVSVRAIREGAQKGFRLLVTVDCGITAVDAVATARALGMDVIIIDHHQIPPSGVPNANVILNPQQGDCAYPFKGLSAGGLAFKLSQALIGRDAEEFLDLAALSTVCDVAPLVEENRIIVKKGMEVLRDRKNIGLKALAEIAGIRSKKINVGHIGFILGPRINAAGRMSSPVIAFQLLVTSREKEAASLAKILDEENKIRQKEERQVVREAVTEVEKTVNFNRDRVIVVARQGWHQGVIGIVASRLVERYHRPAVVIAMDGEKGKGSGRSIKNFHLQKAFAACHEHLEEYGGHAQAAGLEISSAKLADFRRRINQHAHEVYEAENFEREFSMDMELSLQDLRSSLMRELEHLEPHGIGNPRPSFFTSGLELKRDPVEVRYQGTQLWVTDGIQTYEAMWKNPSGDAQKSGLKKGMRFSAVYTVKTKVWDGVESLILNIKQLLPEDPL